ncbi:response regulator transcription factor [Actinomycetospora chibensis]|uniref:Winged helix-turn-helix domain-containing protein n=1 Tax=Actinomycetospora chibensis TaxID=663606 RepID=A0ABV9RNN4_9PSEU|nr:response regulator transcription factor [Actinomycetospora chibensis]MDD7923264.1 response regulator transcription factor [Actinomycetospora chibensis]
MGTRVLLVEDDERIRQALGLALADEGYDVVETATGEEALEVVDPDLDVVLLDLMLPGIDGIEVCSTLRSRGDLPIIIATARSDTADVIAGLEAGADDYVTKPLIAGELAARIKALLRRRRPAGAEEAPSSPELRLGDLVISPGREAVERAGQPLHLTHTEFRLLVELATARGDVVTREQLLQRVWGYDYFGDTRLLDVHVRRLRRKIEPDPDDPTLVLTVRGSGYRTGP